MSKPVCLKDIAERVGVSVPLVSKVLNGAPCRISEEKRKEVLLYADTLGYSLKKKNETDNIGNKTFGIVVPNLEREFFSSLANEIASEAEKHRYNTCILLSREDSLTERRCIEMCNNMHFAGIFINPAGMQQNCEYYRWLESAGIPIVFVDRHPTGIGFTSVSSNNKFAAFYMTEQLIKLGHEDIVFIIQGEVEFTSVVIDRFSGYCEAMSAHNLSAAKETVYCDIDVLGQPLINFDRYTAAVLCTSTKIVQILRAVKEVRSSSSKLAIATFDPIQMLLLEPEDAFMFDFVTSNVIIAEQNTNGIASSAVKKMMEILAGNESDEQVVVECRYRLMD